MKQPFIVIAGPTGTGKSELAVRIAVATGGEIVNFDSVQTIRGFDIGSAKPSRDLQAAAPHHLIDVAEATDDCNAAWFACEAEGVCDAIQSRGRRVILAGGTFFYLRALLSGLPEMPPRNEELRARIRAIARRARGPHWLHAWLARVDPVSAGRLPPADRHRVERALEVWVTTRRPISNSPPPGGSERFASLKLALRLDRATLNERLDRRVELMYASGILDETRHLLERYPADAKPFGTIGYKEAAAVVLGTLSAPQAVEETKRRTRAYAKRQMTWLRSERDVHWLDATDQEESFRAAMRLIEGTTR